MRETTKKPVIIELPPERCDTKVWSGDCAHSDETSEGKEYLCEVCGTVRGLNHEVHHEQFPHVSGDTDNLS